MPQMRGSSPRPDTNRGSQTLGAEAAEAGRDLPSCLTPAKVLLLAVHFAAHADMESFAALARTHSGVLHEELVLRLLLTHLPETVTPDVYVDFLAALARGQLKQEHPFELDASPVSSLTDGEATKKAKRLNLRSFLCQNVHPAVEEDAISSFLVLRARLMESEAGMLTQLLDLLLPFIHRNVGIYTWTACTAIPYIRRNLGRNFGKQHECSLYTFEKLPDRQASEYLLTQSFLPSRPQKELLLDLKRTFGPWLYDSRRWEARPHDSTTGTSEPLCQGWAQALESLLLAAASSWRTVISVLKTWEGPSDVAFGHGIVMQLPLSHRDHLRQTYTRATLACAFTIQEASLDCLDGLFQSLVKRGLKFGNTGVCPSSIGEIILKLPDLSLNNSSVFHDERFATFMRHNLLEGSNPLTNPNEDCAKVALGLTLSAYILSLYGSPSSVRRTGDLMFLRDRRDQKTEVTKLLRVVGSRMSTENNESILQVRRQLLWLRDWGNTEAPGAINGPLALVGAPFIETEFLKVLLSSGRYELARSLYGDDGDTPLSKEAVHAAVYEIALEAFDNASNPDRNRGGLKKCDDIIHAFPAVRPGADRMQALLKATHALSDYHLVLKQGEPFSPVVLRVHSDPISIIEKVLDQNPRAYTRLHEFIEMGMDLIRAGLLSQSNVTVSRVGASESLSLSKELAERRIIAMCIKAALKEDDFETAYSYVANRLCTTSRNTVAADEWSWKAAVLAGQYIRTGQSQQPTHLGTASGNLEIRHLEQRMECLAMALRVAPAKELQGVLKSFRRCEEQLDSAIKDEAANEAAWHVPTDVQHLPGTFEHRAMKEQFQPRNISATVAARQTEEAPMSLFDLSRATARAAQRNFAAIPSFPGVADGASSPASEVDGETHHRIRKRDQLREAATGTLVSGVGWLIGANVGQPRADHG